MKDPPFLIGKSIAMLVYQRVNHQNCWVTNPNGGFESRDDPQSGTFVCPSVKSENKFRDQCCTTGILLQAYIFRHKETEKLFQQPSWKL